MKIVVFGLSVTSSWGNGHATLWRGLARGLGRLGHRTVFFERDVPYYSAHRDRVEIPGLDVRLYSDWAEVEAVAREELRDADAGIVTSYCPDGRAASKLVLGAPLRARAFYDLDTPITLERLAGGEPVAYLPEDGLSAFDLVLSYTGGPALPALRSVLGARRVAPLYGSFDPEVHHPEGGRDIFRADLSYLGTYAIDRQPALDSLLLEPARQRPDLRFLIGGSMYPKDFPWAANVFYVPHVPAPDHPAFYASSPLTLSVTRRAMARSGYCPSGRLFEAAACATAIATDPWPGCDEFFAPGSEILIVDSTASVLAALARPREELAAIGRAARARALRDHTAARRAEELEALIVETSR